MSEFEKTCKPHPLVFPLRDAGNNICIAPKDHHRRQSAPWGYQKALLGALHGKWIDRPHTSSIAHAIRNPWFRAK